jgi:NAD(P)-dependent dehydrogenase (short-subunit alcohol dehydrogenase family)
MLASPVYAATKSAVIHFTRSLGPLYESHNIKVCAICPTFTGWLQQPLATTLVILVGIDTMVG